eukprot:m.174911 g.174911  ORF g.174911 m.174911 type:complete len:169 (+) comp25289_c0_seq1:989-1495(+)
MLFPNQDLKDLLRAKGKEPFTPWSPSTPSVGNKASTIEHITQALNQLIFFLLTSPSPSIALELTLYLEAVSISSPWVFSCASSLAPGFTSRWCFNFFGFPDQNKFALCFEVVVKSKVELYCSKYKSPYRACLHHFVASGYVLFVCSFLSSCQRWHFLQVLVKPIQLLL